MTAIAKLGQFVPKYWPIQNFTRTLWDAKVESFEQESADDFYRQLGDVDKAIMIKPEIKLVSRTNAKRR